MQKLFENWRRYIKNYTLVESLNPIDLPGECLRCPNTWGPFYKGPLRGKKKTNIDEVPHIKKALQNSREDIDHYIDKWGWPKPTKTEAKADKIYKRELKYAAAPGWKPQGYLPETALFEYIMPWIFQDELAVVGPRASAALKHAIVSNFKKQPGRRQRPLPYSLWSDYLKRTLPPEYQFSNKTHPSLNTK